MNKKNLMPNQAQPITRNATGKLPSELAELSEEVLGQNALIEASVMPSVLPPKPACFCIFCW